MTKSNSQFLTQLEATELQDGTWRLDRPLFYFSSRINSTLFVPAGFTTNFMSVPRWPFVYAWLGDKYRRAGALHDYLYGSGCVSRYEADMILREAMNSLGASTTEINACWLAVRIGGWSRYGIK